MLLSVICPLWFAGTRTNRTTWGSSSGKSPTTADADHASHRACIGVVENGDMSSHLASLARWLPVVSKSYSISASVRVRRCITTQVSVSDIRRGRPEVCIPPATSVSLAVQFWFALPDTSDTCSDYLHSGRAGYMIVCRWAMA